MPLLQMRILRHREGESFAQGNTDRKYQRQSVRLPGGCACLSLPVLSGKPVQLGPSHFPSSLTPQQGSSQTCDLYSCMGTHAWFHIQVLPS